MKTPAPPMTESHNVHACGHWTMVANRDHDIIWDSAECPECLALTPSERHDQGLTNASETHYGPETDEYISETKKSRSELLRTCRTYLEFFSANEWTAEHWVEDYVPLSTMWFAELLKQEFEMEGSSDIEAYLPGLDEFDAWMGEMEDIVEDEHPYGWFQFCGDRVGRGLITMTDEVTILKDAVRTLYREFVQDERVSGVELKVLRQMGSPGRKVLERPANRHSISMAETLMAQSTTPVVLSPEQPKERKVRYLTRARVRQRQRGSKRPAKRRLEVQLEEGRPFPWGSVTPGRRHVIILDGPLTPSVVAWLDDSPTVWWRL